MIPPASRLLFCIFRYLLTKMSLFLLCGIMFLIMGSGISTNPSGSHDKNMSKAANDTARVSALCQQAVNLRRQKPEKALALAFTARALSDSLNDIYSKARSRYTLGMVYHAQYKLAEARAAYLKADTLLRATEQPVLLADVQNKIGITYGMGGNYDSALIFFEQSRKMYEKLGMNIKVADCLNNQGNVLKYQGKFDRSIQSYQKALELYSSEQDSGGMASCYDNIGIVYDLQGNYPLALEYYFKSLPLRESLGDTSEITNSLCNIGIMYYYVGDYEKAREYQERNAELSMAIHDLRGVGIAYNNLGSIMENTEKPAKAKDYYRKAISIFNNSGDIHALVDANTYLGNLFLKSNNPDSAFWYLEKALQLAQKINYLQGLGNAQLGMGKLASLNGDEKSALTYFVQAFETGKALGMPEIMMTSAGKLSEIFHLQGDDTRAYQYHVLFKQMSDSLINRENIQHLTRLEMEHSFGKKQDSLKLEQAKKDFRQKMVMKRQKTFRNLLIAGVIVLFIILALVYRIYLQKRKANAEKDILLREIHHRVKNNLQMITSLLSHQGVMLPDTKLQVAIEESQGRVQSIAIIHDMLYHSDHLKDIAMKPYLQKLVSSTENMFSNGDGKIIIEADDIFFDVDTAVPVGLIVNELVTNAFKHAFPVGVPGTVSVKLEKKHNNGYDLTVQDNGIGISNIPDLNDLPDTLGLRLVNILTRQLGGSLEISVNKGTTVIIHFTNRMET